MSVKPTQSTHSTQANNHLELKKSAFSIEVMFQSLVQAMSDVIKKASQKAPLGDGPSSPSNPAPTNSELILESMLEALQSGQSVKEACSQSVVEVLAFMVAQVESLSDLAEEIQQLKNSLSKNLSPKQIKQITSELASLESEYQSALNKYKSASQDKSSKESDEASEQEAYNQALAMYNQLPDKSSPAAKQLKAAMDKAQSAIKSDKSAISSDNTKIAHAGQEIAQVATSINKLVSDYPSVANALKALENAVMAHQPDTTFTHVIQQFNMMGIQDKELSSEITLKQSVFQSLIDEVSKSNNQVSEALKTFLKSHSGALSPKDLMRLMDQLLHNETQLQSIEKSHKQSSALVEKNNPVEEASQKRAKKKKEAQIIQHIDVEINRRMVRG